MKFSTLLPPTPWDTVSGGRSLKNWEKVLLLLYFFTFPPTSSMEIAGCWKVFRSYLGGWLEFFAPRSFGMIFFDCTKNAASITRSSDSAAPWQLALHGWGTHQKSVCYQFCGNLNEKSVKCSISNCYGEGNGEIQGKGKNWEKEAWLWGHQVAQESVTPFGTIKCSSLII